MPDHSPCSVTSDNPGRLFSQVINSQQTSLDVFSQFAPSNGVAIKDHLQALDTYFPELRVGFYQSACNDNSPTVLGVACSEARSGMLVGGLASSLPGIFSLLDDLGRESPPSSSEAASAIIRSMATVGEVNQVVIFQQSFFAFNEGYNGLLADSFSTAAITSLWINLLLIAALLLFFVGGWCLFLLRFQHRIKASKDVLSLLPGPILTQNLRVSKFLQEVLNEINQG